VLVGTAVVTGAASGIGLALARQLAGEGHLVHLADLTPTDVLAEKLGGVPVQVDVADSEEMEALAHTVPDVEVVCLNAGIVGAALGTPWEAPPQEWQRLLGVNLLGVVNGLRAFVPMLLANRRPARIMITASLAGLVTFPRGGAYAATKHAVVAVAEQAAMALRDTDITVTLLCPALVRSGMSDAGDDPADIAKAALAASRAGRFLVLPEEWADAVRLRAVHLLNGEEPLPPEPRADR
jgi:NAD(P)-dependent dehydrogenase (short-subunit alcohol dehydrogenase family)